MAVLVGAREYAVKVSLFYEHPPVLHQVSGVIHDVLDRAEPALDSLATVDRFGKVEGDHGFGLHCSPLRLEREKPLNLPAAIAFSISDFSPRVMS